MEQEIIKHNAEIDFLMLVLLAVAVGMTLLTFLFFGVEFKNKIFVEIILMPIIIGGVLSFVFKLIDDFRNKFDYLPWEIRLEVRNDDTSKCG